MSINYFHIEADGVAFQGRADSDTGDVTFSVLDGPEGAEVTATVHMSAATAEMIALGLLGLSKPGDD